jgi:von Willebrand factor type A domain
MRTIRAATRNCLICLLGFAGWLPASLHAENAPCLPRTTLIAMAGANGELVEGLTAPDFKVTVAGKAASIESVKVAERPPRVVILLDASANHDQSTWAATQTLVDEFLAGFPEVADLTLLMFDDKVERVIDATSRRALQGALGEMFPTGKKEAEAGLLEAIKQGSASFGGYREGDAEFIVTTADQVHKETEEALNQQRMAGTRLFGASFDQARRYGPDRFGTGMTLESYSPLEAAVKASGGRWVWFDMSQDPAVTSRNAMAAGKSIAALARDYLVLELRLASPIMKPEKMKIELVKGAKVKGQDRFAAYPQELFPCQ